MYGSYLHSGRTIMQTSALVEYFLKKEYVYCCHYGILTIEADFQYNISINQLGLRIIFIPGSNDCKITVDDKNYLFRSADEMLGFLRQEQGIFQVLRKTEETLRRLYKNIALLEKMAYDVEL